MAGAKAVMAVTPQIEVPAVNNRDNSRDNPAARPASGIKRKPALMAPTTTGRPWVPAVSNSTKDNLAATATMPPCKIVLVAKVMPGFIRASLLPPITVFFRPMPSKMATGIPDSGKANAVDRAEAAAKPPAAVTAESATPGTNALVESERIIEGSKVGRCCFGSFSSSSLGMAEKWRKVHGSFVFVLVDDDT